MEGTGERYRVIRQIAQYALLYRMTDGRERFVVERAFFQAYVYICVCVCVSDFIYHVTP